MPGLFCSPARASHSKCVLMSVQEFPSTSHVLSHSAAVHGTEEHRVQMGSKSMIGAFHHVIPSVASSASRFHGGGGELKFSASFSCRILTHFRQSSGSSPSVEERRRMTLERLEKGSVTSGAGAAEHKPSASSTSSKSRLKQLGPFDFGFLSKHLAVVVRRWCHSVS